MEAVLQSAQEKLSPEAFSNVTRWFTDPSFAGFHTELRELLTTGDWDDIEDRFYTRIAVGTGGIRGTIGTGPNRINNRTISEAAQGLSQFIHDFGEGAVSGGVVIGYEARRFAREYAELSAEVFAANGIASHLFPHMCATPELSFAVRHLKKTAGVMITASHNPRTDNGFKFYWSDGGQVVPPADLKFMELVNNVKEIHRMPLVDARGKNLVQDVASDVDEAYLAAVRGLSMNPRRSAHIVFSPIHGAGSTNVLPILRAEGYEVEVVQEQMEPDAEFPTAHGDLINPEFFGVIERAVKLGETLGADIAIVSDPDADRIGVAAKKEPGADTLVHLNGDEVGSALVHYMLSQLKEKGTIAPDKVVIETFVTTSLITDIANTFGVEIHNDLLVGFKFIAEIIEKLDRKERFVIGAEESLGYLAGTFVRDKDAAIAALLLAELTSLQKDNGKTLVQYLDDIYREYGYYKTILKYMEMKGKEGFLRKERIMKGLRAEPPKAIAGYAVLDIVDRLPEESRKPENYVVGRTGDMITFILSDDRRSRVTVRPSGTEPMIKCYIQHYRLDTVDLEATRTRINKEAQRMVDEIVIYNNERAKVL